MVDGREVLWIIFEGSEGGPRDVLVQRWTGMDG